jgi:hypothetical protein
MMINVHHRRRNGLQEEPNQDKENVPPPRKQRKINICSPLIIKGKWTSEALEEAMDAIENGTISLRKASRHWNIPLTSLSYHLYGKTRSRKLGPGGVLIVEEDQVVIVWVLSMYEVGLLISLQWLKTKVENLTQTRPTPFQGGVLGSSWWY